MGASWKALAGPIVEALSGEQEATGALAADRSSTAGVGWKDLMVCHGEGPHVCTSRGATWAELPVRGRTCSLNWGSEDGCAFRPGAWAAVARP
jgi:hypothetical protein